jgi:hypothetical protein
MNQNTHTNNLILKIGEESFSKLPQDVRLYFEVLKVEPEDKELFDGDERYSNLMREYRKSSKQLTEYKFNKRHSK